VNAPLLFWMMLGAALAEGAWAGQESFSKSSDTDQVQVTKSELSINVSGIDNSEHAVPQTILPAVINSDFLPTEFPYEYVGKMTIEGKETLLLSKGEDVFYIAEGDILENLYRVEQIGKDSMELSYLPDAHHFLITLDSIAKRPALSTETDLENGVMESFPLQHPEDFTGAGIVLPDADSGLSEEEILESMDISPSLPESELIEQMLAPVPTP